MEDEGELTAYEIARRERLAQNQARMQQLGLQQVRGRAAPRGGRRSSTAADGDVATPGGAGDDSW